jgi:proliferating cell nuclear antigen
MDITDSLAKMSIDGGLMQVVCESPDVIRKMFSLLDELSNDVNVQFTENGLKIQSMDTSHVCLTLVKISKDFFSSYNVPKFHAIGMKLSSLVRVLTCIEGQFAFEYSDKSPDELVICSENEHFSLRTIDIDSEEMDVPDTEYDVEIDADASVLQKHFKNIAAFGDTTKITVENGNISASASGEIGTASIVISGSRVKITGTLSVGFASRYLVTFAKAASISKVANLFFANEQPAVMKYEFGKDSYISFFLAPKIEDDEDDE